jgi:hypothetical protein
MHGCLHTVRLVLTVQGLIFVVDAADEQRIDEAAEALSSVLQHPQLLVSLLGAVQSTWVLACSAHLLHIEHNRTQHWEKACP